MSLLSIGLKLSRVRKKIRSEGIAQPHYLSPLSSFLPPCTPNLSLISPLIFSTDPLSTSPGYVFFFILFFIVFVNLFFFFLIYLLVFFRFFFTYLNLRFLSPNIYQPMRKDNKIYISYFPSPSFRLYVRTSKGRPDLKSGPLGPN